MINEDIDIKNKVSYENGLSLKIPNGNIEFKNISFKYELKIE